MLLSLKIQSRKFMHLQWTISIAYGALFCLAIFFSRQLNNTYFYLMEFFLLVLSHKLLLSFANVEEKESIDEASSNKNIEQINLVKDKEMPVTDDARKSFEYNSIELYSMSTYLSKTSDYLLGIFQDQFLILNKVDDHAKKTRALVNDVEIKINDAAASSAHAREGADAGRTDMENLSTSVKSLEEVRILLADFSNIFKTLNSQMSEIDSIVHTSKILSFNASIEAARAGEHGKGFAVVAQEMRSLTQQIGETSQNIQSSLKVSNDSLSAVGKRVGSLLSESTGLIHSSQKSINLIIEEFYILSEKIAGVSDSLGGYKKSTVELDEILSRIAKTSNTLGTASANTKLAQINLEDLKSYNDTIIATEQT